MFLNNILETPPNSFKEGIENKLKLESEKGVNLDFNSEYDTEIGSRRLISRIMASVHVLSFGGFDTSNSTARIYYSSYVKFKESLQSSNYHNYIVGEDYIICCGVKILAHDDLDYENIVLVESNSERNIAFSLYIKE